MSLDICGGWIRGPILKGHLVGTRNTCAFGMYSGMRVVMSGVGVSRSDMIVTIDDLLVTDRRWSVRVNIVVMSDVRVVSHVGVEVGVNMSVKSRVGNGSSDHSTILMVADGARGRPLGLEDLLLGAKATTEPRTDRNLLHAALRENTENWVSSSRNTGELGVQMRVRSSMRHSMSSGMRDGMSNGRCMARH